ncbi:cytochrome P450 76T24-like [Rutidosis leptorrhynchoides]|uniref:cytochrome P450 76T24-like n=1 Tax=Rutidosis leptorrhynchoides TaxID=125765 RepID=UPI003A995118
MAIYKIPTNTLITTHMAIMDYPTLCLLFSLLLTFIYVATISGRRISRLPPGPYPYPIIGNLLSIGVKPHISLATLSKRYGPLMSLKLGTKTTIVVSSPDIAKQFFHTHDLAFSSRSVPDTGQVVGHDKYSMVWLPVGDQWRKLRKITREHILSVQRLDASEDLRQKKVQELLDHVNHCCINKKAVNIGAVVFTTALNILSNYIFSIDLAQYDSVSSQEFKEAVSGLLEIGGKPNLADFFPILKPFDPQGLLRKGNVYGKKLMDIFDRLIDQRLQIRSSSSSSDDIVNLSANKDVLDLLLDLNQESESQFSRNDMRHLFMALFIAGTDTSTGTIEWAMTELIRNKTKMEKTQFEIMKLKDDKNIQEMDISRLPYLQGVIKETLRLHPPAPFLIPHLATQNVEVQGFIVPKNAEIICNVWAMGQDPNIWSDPKMFIPERFLDVKIDYKGQDYNLIPFGAGRRICPGLNMGHRMLHIILGSLIHKFNWKLEKNMKVQDIDMDEKFGLTLQRKVPLMAIPISNQ